MKRWHNLVHYRLSSTLMIVGIAISFICFFNCVNLYHLLSMERKEEKEYRYNSQMSMQYLNVGEDAILGDFLTSSKGILRMKDVLLFRNRADVPGLTDILLSQNEPLGYPVLEGELPETDQDISEPTVILGCKQLENAVFENGHYYYELEGVRCRVCAILGTKNSELFDYNVILYYKGMEEALHNVVDRVSAADIEIESNLEQAETIFDVVRQQVNEKTEAVMVSGVGGSIVLNERSAGEDSSYYLIIFLFCFVNIVFVSEYWIKRRYREIAIRKIFGYSDRKIYGLLYRDMVINVSIAVLIAAGVQIFLQYFFKEYLILYKSHFGFYLGCSVLFVFALSALIMIYPFRLMRKEDVLKQMISKCG